MKLHRLAIVRQKISSGWGSRTFCLQGTYRAVRHIQNLRAQRHHPRVAGRKAGRLAYSYYCDPRKWGRISRERGFAHAARALWQQQQFDIVQSHERIPGCDIYRAGDGVHRRWLLQRTRVILPAWRAKLLMHDRYHRYARCTQNVGKRTRLPS